MSPGQTFEFSAQGSFSQSPARVFEALTDLDDARNWMPGLLRLERLDDGPVAIGTCWRVTRTMLGVEATEEFTVTAHGPPTTLELRVDGSKGKLQAGEIRFHYSIRPGEPGTQVSLDGRIAGVSGLAAMMGKLLSGTLGSACEEDLQALAAHLSEGEDGDPGPEDPTGRAIP